MEQEKKLYINEERKDHFLISPTAKFVAYYKEQTDIPYSREVTQKIDAKTAALELIGSETVLESLNSFLPPFLESRYKCIDQQLQKTGYKNVLELAAGIAPRGYIMSKDPNVRYVDTDLDTMLAEREKLFSEILAQEGTGQKPNHRSQKANALSLVDLQNASKYFSGEPFAVVHEGLLFYLSREEKRAMARNLHTILRPSNGVWITPDVNTKERLNAILQKDPRYPGILAILSGVTKSDLFNNSFEDTDDAIQFYKSCGFDIERQSAYDGSYELSSMQKLNLDPKKVLPLIKAREIWAMRPK